MSVTLARRSCSVSCPGASPGPRVHVAGQTKKSANTRRRGVNVSRSRGVSRAPAITMNTFACRRQSRWRCVLGRLTVETRHAGGEPCSHVSGCPPMLDQRVECAPGSFCHSPDEIICQRLAFVRSQPTSGNAAVAIPWMTTWQSVNRRIAACVSTTVAPTNAACRSNRRRAGLPILTIAVPEIRQHRIIGLNDRCKLGHSSVSLTTCRAISSSSVQP